VALTVLQDRPAASSGTAGEVVDRLGRPLADLRISVTDRCNFRCTYCMPRELFGADHPFLARAAILSFEEIERLARLFVELGVHKLRLTGGEPLLRRDLAKLVERLAVLPVDLALTTNGSLLAAQADGLRRAGLGRLTVSLDTLEPEVFRRINDADYGPDDVLEGIAAAERAGFTGLKINAVVRRGVNEESVVPLVERFRGSGHVVRFVEFMDVGHTNGWRLDEVVTAREILDRLRARWELEPVGARYRGEVAKRWRFRDGSGEIGLIASVSQPFCGDCTRLRLSADGKLFTCLFGESATDLKGPMRSGAADEEIRTLVRGLWSGRVDRYSELRSAETAALPRAEMSYIGG
jgi:cyclic pyranopterin phosphate synthase